SDAHFLAMPRRDGGEQKRPHFQQPGRSCATHTPASKIDVRIRTCRQRRRLFPGRCINRRLTLPPISGFHFHRNCKTCKETGRTSPIPPSCASLTAQKAT